MGRRKPPAAERTPPRDRRRRHFPVTTHGVVPAIERLARPLAIGAIVIATAGLLAIALGPHTVGDYYAETDFYGAYAEGSRMIQEGHLDPARYTVIGPVYDIALAMMSSVVRDRFLSGELISVIAASVTLILWFVLIARRIGESAGLWTVFFLAMNGTFIRYGYSASTDALALALQAGALFALLAMRGPLAPVWSGALTGLAVLTRYNAVYLIPVALAYYLWLADSPTQRLRWRSLIQYCVASAALLVPWWAITAAGGYRPGSELYHNIAYDIYANARGLTWDQYQTQLQPRFHGLWDVVRLDPVAVLKRECHNLVTHARNDLRDLLGWGPAVACCIGIALGLAGAVRRQILPLAVSAALLFLTLVPVLHSTRYSLALLPMYLSFAGLAIASPRFAMILRKPTVPLKWALGLVLLGSAGTSAYHLQRYLMTQLPIELLPASQALRQVARPDERIMARKPHIAYYAQVAFAPFPNVATLAELADYCRQQQVQYMYFSWPEADLRPQFSYLLDTSAAIPGLTVVREIQQHPAVVYRIGERFGETPTWLADDSARKIHDARAKVLIHEDEAWQAHFTLGVAAGREGRYQDACAHLERVTRRRPELVRAWILLGEAHLKLNQFAEARSDFATGLAKDPKSVDARLGLGWAELHGGQPERAAQTWRPIVTKTTHGPTLTEMIRLYSRTGDRKAMEEAEATLAARSAEAVEGNETNP